MKDLTTIISSVVLQWFDTMIKTLQLQLASYIYKLHAIGVSIQIEIYG